MQETQQELEAVRLRASQVEEELGALQAASGDLDRLRQKVRPRLRRGRRQVSVGRKEWQGTDGKAGLVFLNKSSKIIRARFFWFDL